MLTLISRRMKLKTPQKDYIFILPKHFSSKISSSDDSKIQSFTVSYLINSCGLSPKDAISTSKKVKIKTPENPDAVLQLLSKYVSTSHHIPKIVKKCPQLLLANPEKFILPKLEFFLSFGVPLSTLAYGLSVYPLILRRSLHNYLIPTYNYLKDVVKSDEKVVTVFRRAPRAFSEGCHTVISANIAMLRARGLPEHFISKLVVYQPTTIFHYGTNQLSRYVDRAEEMGFDKGKCVFIRALQIFGSLSESTLKRKMDVYRKCGWSESDVNGAFLRHPLCMSNSEKSIIASMDFLVKEVGCEPGDVARNPMFLTLSVDKRMRPRWLVVGILKTKELVKKTITLSTLFQMPEEKFLNKYVLKYETDFPQLMYFYKGKMSYDELVASIQLQESLNVET